MKNFLGHLVDRHHSSAQGKDDDRVRPRPRSRFEGALSTVTEERSPTPAPPRSMPDDDVDQTRVVPDQRDRDMNARIDAVAARLGADRRSQRELPLALDRPEAVPKAAVSKVSDETRRLPVENGSASGDSNRRIEEILDRLQHKQADRPVPEREEPAPGDSGRIGRGDEGDARPNFRRPRSESSPDEIDRFSRGHPQAAARTPTRPPERQSGQLQVPDWLTGLRTDLARRWQETNATTEPVVNVTIGRVEVRAVRSETPERPKRKKKPGGVMSLEDYLKQCERKGPR